MLRSGSLFRYASDHSAYSKEQSHWESAHSSGGGEFGSQTRVCLVHLEGETFQIPSKRAEKRTERPVRRLRENPMRQILPGG